MPLLYYVQTNIYCILILLIIYLVLRNRSGTLPERRIVFGRLLITCTVLCFADIFAWAYTGKTVPGAEIILHVSNSVYYAGITLAGYIWLCYVELRVRDQDFDFRMHRRLTAIPLLIMLLVIVTNPWTHVLFSINSDNVYSRESGVVIHWVISWSYLIYATLEVVKRIRESTSRAEKDKFMPMFWFIVFPVIASVLQMYVFGMTLTQSGMTVGILQVAINYLIDEVSRDSLTGLNNRRTLEKAMSDTLQRSNTRITVFMCDVDRFKSINDTLGHTAGDKVLKKMADALRMTCAESDRRLFLCRYGGDEFVICGTDMNDEETEELILNIKNNIESVNSEGSKNLRFGISIGTATEVCRKYEDIERLIRIADESMYEKKQSYKRK